ncbi:MAG: hypothetical protein DRQ47_10680, partial [Gammaproteobacteria bacterium]
MVIKHYHLFLIIILLMQSLVINGEVASTIDRNPVRVNETFELTLHMDTAPISRPPLEGLPPEFEIVRSSSFYQRNSINGKTTVQAGWHFTIKAIEEGVYTIPGFEVDGDLTDSILLKVLPPVSKTDVAGQQDAIRLTAEVNYKSVYVQQQLVYTIRLHRAVQAQYASLTEPSMEG